MSAKRKQSAVLRLLRGEDLELVSRELGMTAAELSAWRDAFLAAVSVHGYETPRRRLRGLGRAELAGADLGRLDEWLCPRVPAPWHYVMIGVARK